MKKAFAKPLLAWFYEHRRVLPFRQDPSPYHIWVSEIMLQQTRMTAAVPYYENFIAALPTPAALSACPPDQLKKLWQGLGYYSRAANLQKVAQIICRDYGGQLPADYDALRALPGIGDYTAGAVASIGFGLPAPAVDGNVLRVATRLCNDDTDVTRPQTKRRYTAWVMENQPADAPGDFNQALMELGALVCLPNGAPQCEACPLAALCEGRKEGRAESLPVKPAKKPRAHTVVSVLLVQSEAGLLLQKRPAHGLLAGLWQPLAFEGEKLDATEVESRLLSLGLRPLTAPQALPPARHVFTHKEWALCGWQMQCAATEPPQGCVWADAQELKSVYAIPSAFAAYVPPKEN